MQDRITDWVNWLRVQLQPYTVQAYEYHLRKLAATAPERRPEEWTTAQLLAHLADRRIGDALTKQVVAAFRNFFQFACGAASPAQGVPYPRVRKRLQRTFDGETMLRILATCDTSTDKGARDLAILTLMLDTGLRASEVCRLQVHKVDFDKRKFSVIVKGGDEEQGFFSRTTASNLTRWMTIRGKHAAEGCDTVFVSFFGTTPGRSLTRDGLRCIFASIAKRAGIKGFSPHDMRRTFATIAIRNGAPTRVVQAAGRWSDVLMVERYTQAIQAEDFEKYSPVESLIMKGRKE